jgi:hypothetical protein
LSLLVEYNAISSRLLLITDQLDSVEYFQLESIISDTGDIIYTNTDASQFNLSNLKISNGTEYESFIPTKMSDLENDTHFATEEYVEQNGGKIDKILLNEVEQEIVNKAVNLTIDKTTVGLSNVDNTSDLDKPMSNETKEAFDFLGATLSDVVMPRLEKADEDITNINNDITNNIKPRITSIEEKIPNQASATNQLADKDFVNSSINSSVAFFKGNFATKADLDAVQWQTTDDTLTTFVSNNDYAYVESDETHNNEA